MDASPITYSNSCLAIRDFRKQIKIAAFVALVTAMVNLLALERLELHTMVRLTVLPITLVYEALLITSLILFRNRGYWLVRVQPKLLPPIPPDLLT